MEDFVCSCLHCWIVRLLTGFASMRNSAEAMLKEFFEKAILSPIARGPDDIYVEK